ncbi:hypothetical protein K227x_09530 [Rubripirellula lacrimiformis]|uniref:Uncharacterized protein n=1 Tax=Rubripirellula lacrimiformis TaxID=1930273 RepID=A0A517N607_9BACT|nr:hypothetical protein [Rubripirellula lacrimiformis]QDT02575.1 hypothetical protein K227x_09530 [Rubripirellula lacrimiformis]
MNDAARNRDYGFIAIVMFVVAISIWLVLMPWVPAIASATMHRFHLRSSSFACWVTQFPIPTMYNFANQVEVTNIPPGFVDPILENPLGEISPATSGSRRYINHFPFRIITFVSSRYRNLKDGTDRWFTLNSSYRGQSIQTRIHADPDGDHKGGYVIVRLPDQAAR